jgi:hypothetical protein
MRKDDEDDDDDDDEEDDAEASMFVFALRTCPGYLYSCLRICANAFRPSWCKPTKVSQNMLSNRLAFFSCAADSERSGKHVFVNA